MTTPLGPPRLRPIDQMPPVRDEAALTWTWQAIIGEPGFSQPQLLVLYLDRSGRPLHVLVVDQVPLSLDAAGAERAVLAATASIAEPGATCAFLFARPGNGPRTLGDLSWSRELGAAMASTGAHRWPVHLANDADIPRR